jgi:D-aminoacyl-tRNA deacylase
VRAVVQRTLGARVEVGDEVVGAIERGLVVFVGAATDDEDADVDYIAGRVAGLRVFQDESGKMARSLADVGGAVLAVSQFTLFGDVRRGLRPSFGGAMEPVRAEVLYERFIAALKARGVTVAAGRFRADMRVYVENDGPVTLLLDSKRTG